MILFCKTHFDIPNVEPLKSKIISNIDIKFRQFKSTLTMKYFFGIYKFQNPCLKYTYIDEET